MKKSRFSEEQIVGVLKQQERGHENRRPVPAIYAGPRGNGNAFGPLVNRTRADQMVNMNLRGKPEVFPHANASKLVVK